MAIKKLAEEDTCRDKTMNVIYLSHLLPKRISTYITKSILNLVVKVRMPLPLNPETYGFHEKLSCIFTYESYRKSNKSRAPNTLPLRLVPNPILLSRSEACAQYPGKHVTHNIH